MGGPLDLQLQTLSRKGTAFPSKPSVLLDHISYCFLLLYRGGLQSLSLSEIQNVLQILAVRQQPPILNRSFERQVCALPDSYGRLPLPLPKTPTRIELVPIKKSVFLSFHTLTDI